MILSAQQLYNYLNNYVEDSMRLSLSTNSHHIIIENVFSFRSAVKRYRITKDVHRYLLPLAQAWDRQHQHQEFDASLHPNLFTGLAEELRRDMIRLLAKPAPKTASDTIDVSKEKLVAQLEVYLHLAKLKLLVSPI